MTIKLFIVFAFGGGRRLVWRLQRYENEAARMYRKISHCKLKPEERLTETRLLDVFRGKTVDEVRNELQAENKWNDLYMELLCWQWSYDEECP